MLPRIPETSVGQNPHLYCPGYEGMRAIACLQVFLYHALWRFGNPQIEFGCFDVDQLIKTMDGGVCIFFVLSGLLLSLPFWNAILHARAWPSSIEYLRRRAARIVPAYFAILVILYLLNPSGIYSLKGMTDFGLHVLFLHTFFEFSYGSVNPVLWSIGIEFQFYLLLPLIMAGLCRLSMTRLRPAGACVVLCLICWAIGLMESTVLRLIPNPIPFASLRSHETILWYLQFFAGGITAGMIVASLQRSIEIGNSPQESQLATLLAAVAVVSLTISSYFGQEGDWRKISYCGWPMNVITIGILLCCIPQSRLFRSVLSAKTLCFVGTISYGLYLWHWPVQIAVAGGTLPGRFAGSSLVAVGGGVSLAVSLLFACASYYIIEIPGQKYIRNVRLQPSKLLSRYWRVDTKCYPNLVEQSINRGQPEYGRSTEKSLPQSAN